MTPSPSSSPFRTPPQVNRQGNEQDFFQPVTRAQENLIFAIRNIREDEFDRYLDQALLDGASLNSMTDDGFYPLELAVIEMRPRIVESLLARGALLPVVAEDGYDLVMLAASRGHSAMLSVLIDTGSMMSDARDCRGLTPLHYAVVHGHLQAVMTLLDRDADIDSLTTDAVDRKICEKLNIHPSLVGSHSTPLMLAVSTGNILMTDLLLSRQADPIAGARHPLEIAIINDDVSMIDLFIKRGIHPATMSLRNGQSLLSFAVEQQCSLPCIQKLLPARARLEDHSRTTHSPLRIAIRTGQHEIAAYLLCQGAQPESAREVHRTSWEFAKNLPDQGKMTNILIATRCAHAVNFCIQSHEGFVGLYQLARHPSELAIRGLFPELLTPLVTALQPLHTTLHLLTPAQKELEIAHALMQLNAPDTTMASPAPAPLNHVIAASPEQQLIQSIPEKINAQKKELHEWAKYLVDNKMMMIPDYYSKNFLISMKASCPEGTQLSTFMLRKLREQDGIPDNLSEIIVSAWTAADENVNHWHLPGAGADRIAQCKEYYAINQIERVLFSEIMTRQFEGKEPSAGDTFAHKLSREQTLPVNQFGQNPVIFLHGLEHPIGQPSLNDAQLSVAFCLTTGLTPLKSQAIINAWRNTRQAAERRFPPSEIEGRFHFSCTMMASTLKSLLPPQQHYPDGTLVPMPSRWETQLHHWCDVTLAASQRNSRVINRF